MSHEPRKWSLITAKRMAEYCDAAEKLVPQYVQLAKSNGAPPFAAALAACSVIHAINKSMGGDIEWWIELLREPEAMRSKYMVDVDGPPNLVRGGKT